MVNTKSQTAENIPTNMNGTDRYSDSESEDSIPDILTREHINEFDNGNMLDNRNDIERRTVNQRFSEMNKQITELTNLVLVLTEKISSSNREGNALSTAPNWQDTRSDTCCALLLVRQHCQTIFLFALRSVTASTKTTE